MTNLDLNDFLATLKVGGTRASKLQAGKTALYIIADESGHAGFIGATHEQYQDDPPRDKFVFYAVPVYADDSSKFAEGWQRAAVPFIMSKTAMTNIGKAMMPVDENDPFYDPDAIVGTLTELDPTNGKLTLGTPFLITMEKAPNSFWDFPVKVLKRLPKGAKAPASVEVPEMSIAEYAQGHTEWQERMTAKRQIEAGTPDNSADDDLF
jgi:hypothetical protein